MALFICGLGQRTTLFRKIRDIIILCTLFLEGTTHSYSPLAEPLSPFQLTVMKLDANLRIVGELLFSMSFLITQVRAANGNCAKHNLDFIMIDGDANMIALEDDIRSQLAIVGFNVSTRMLSKESFNEAHQSGDFHLSLTETWGAPYDPHSYANGWVAANDGSYQAMTNFEAPATRDVFFQDIDTVLREDTNEGRETQWKSILTTLHNQAIMLPLWGKRIPTVLSNRLSGYEAGLQQFDYPVHRLNVLSGSTTITVSPGAQTGIFKSVGLLNPHTYRPNEFFCNNWVYEGLVAYGAQGQILPALAVSWTTKDIADGGEEYIFSLRPNVTFHDGAPWNCDAAKLNFDHVLADPLTTADYHGWYGTPGMISSWTCASNLEFVVTLKEKYYTFLQELTYIRPLRMLSPTAFVGNGSSVNENSCHVGWGNVTTEKSSVTCKGITNVSGTGPFVFASRTSSSSVDDADDEVVFVRNEKHWGAVGAIERLVIVRYDTPADVVAALRNGSLDTVWGAGVLTAQDLKDLSDEPNFSVFHTDDVQNTIILLNSGKAPLDDITIRKALIHSVNKVDIIEKELGGFERPVDNVFPLDAPYCDLDLTPRWDYDFEKAILLNCNNSTEDESSGSESSSTGNESSSSDDSNLALILGLVLGAVCAFLIFITVLYYNRSLKAENALAELRREEKAVAV